MIFHSIGKPTKTKKATYLISFTTFGILLSFNLHALIEINYLSWILSQGRVPYFYGSCALHPAITIIIWSLGLVCGYFLGIFFWQKIYVERCWEKSCKHNRRKI